MKKQIIFPGLALFCLWFWLTALTGMASQQEEKKEGEQEQEKVLNLEDAQKQAAQPKGEGEYTKEEYDLFQKYLNDPDLKTRASGLLEFIHAHPKSKLSEHAVSVLPSVLAQLYQQKDMTALATAAEGFLQLKPEDVAALGLATEAFYTNKDYAKAVKYGEAFYAQKPSVQVAQLLAQSFEQLKNDAKFAVYAEKCSSEMSAKDAFFYSAKLSYYYASRKEISKAAQHCQKMVAAYGEGETPSGYTAATWGQERARAYSIVGRNAYERKQYAGAVLAYTNSLKSFRQNDEAYYYLGMSYWGANDTSNAVKAFAKGYSLNKPYSKMCRERLEVLWKATHNNTLEGLDAVLRVASAELK